MELTRSEFFQWAFRQTQNTENEMLEPHNRDVPDSEIVDVLSWQKFTHIICSLLDGNIQIKEEDHEG
ncbi:hypothetical protein [Enterococcus mundtii]|uniref:hypothetical protein n=1 Tax=Enterococcus mundtii TaxID=53346 RepID=UPI001A968D2A|nr:hypothetical protein [Enterococcus mundtii]MBO1087191.1 hypothetical protein [Enterococcus mundtii]